MVEKISISKRSVSLHTLININQAIAQCDAQCDWTNEKKSSLIESIISNTISIGEFWIDRKDYDSQIVVDGNKRLLVIKSYINNEFELSGLSWLAHLNNLKFSEIRRPIQRKIEECTVMVNYIEAGTPSQAITDIIAKIK